MDENNMQQGAQSEGGDSFLEGWEETSPIREEADSGEPGGDQAGEGENPQSAGADSSLPEGSQGVSSGASGQNPSGTGGDQAGENPQSAGADSSLPEGSQGVSSGASGQNPSGTGGDQAGENQPAPQPKTWTLTHMGQPVTVSEADVPVLAQKGLDYDRIRAAYDESRPVMDLFRDFARQYGIPVTEYVARLRAQAKQAQGMDENAARRAVELEDREARVSAKEEEDRRQREAMEQAQAREAQLQARVQSDIREFMSVFPDAARNFRDIPKEVWDAVNGGMSLVAAYARHSAAQAQANTQAQEEARRQEAVRQQNAQNAAASTGSMKSAGNNHGPKDPFLEGWGE